VGEPASRRNYCVLMDSPLGCLDEGREAMLHAALPVRRTAFGMLLAGSPVSIEDVASAAHRHDETSAPAAARHRLASARFPASSNASAASRNIACACASSPST
jgi:hypothetical protein